MAEVEVGRVHDFFAHPVVAGIELTGELRVGDTVHISGHTTDLRFRVESMQIDHREVPVAGAGQSIGLKVPERVRHGDHVFKVLPE
jgi:selenocysteine-specific translation elongation factor